MHATLDAPTRTLTRCLVCGFTEVETDEVVHRGVVLLHECPRCDHRWTRPGELPRAEPLSTRRVESVRPRPDRELPDAA